MNSIQILLILIWAIVIIFSITLECLTTSVIAVWFSLGALAALIISAFSIDWYWQLLAFILVSFFSLLIGYPLLKKFVIKKKYIRTNIDALINQEAVMLNNYNSNNIEAIGLAKLDGKTWTVTNNENEIFSENENVLVIGIVGVKLVIQKIRSNKCQ